MSLYQKIEEQGLSADQATRVFQDEMIRYRNMLAYQRNSIQGDREGDPAARVSQMLAIYAAINGDFAANGFNDYMGIDYIGGFDRRFASLDEEARGNLLVMLSRAGDLPANLIEEARDVLRRVGIPATADRLELARRIICEARMVAAGTYEDPGLRSSVEIMAMVTALGHSTVPAGNGAVVGTTFAPSTPAGKDHGGARALPPEQQRYAEMTALEAVDEFMRTKPKAGGKAEPLSGAGTVTRAISGKRNKSQPKVWGDSQRRQFRAAAWLFGKSNGGRALSTVTQEDLNDFYDRLNRLPSSHHKSTRHEKMSLEKICDEAQRQIAKGTAGNFSVGLDVGTINRHFANLKKLCLWYATKTPLAPLDFSDYILDEDDRDDRNERDPYTIEQGRELFGLAIWTGGASLRDRFTPRAGGSVWHDAAYWVMPIVWYSGMRREEACKLLVEDIGEEDGVAFFNIRKTRAGNVKTATSVRKVPINSELRAMGFLDYVAAMKAAGEEYLFPEILPSGGGRGLGDVFFKQIWLKIKPHLKLITPGQAVHSGRHMVSTELKMLQTFEEFRSDLLGQKSGGENASRYAGATRLQILLEVVEHIPIVTDHLPRHPVINLLPERLRQPRPSRPAAAGRRKRI